MGTTRKFTRSKIPVTYYLSLDKFCNQLPKVQKEIFELLCYEGLSPCDISARLCKSKQQVSKVINVLQQKVHSLGTKEAVYLFDTVLERNGMKVERKWPLKKVQSQTKFMTREQAQRLLGKKQ